MDWRIRALLLRAFAALPGGYFIYQLLQRYLGTHCNPKFYSMKLEQTATIAATVLSHGGEIQNAAIVEVGTGWVPVVPLLLSLLGAREVHTFDLHRHILPTLVTRALQWMRRNRHEVAKVFSPRCTEEAVGQFAQARLEKCQSASEILMASRIYYHAPWDATATQLPAHSVNIHYSVSVLEHVPQTTIHGLLREARRLLTDGGLSIHLIDPSDHFSHHDRSISSINMLQFDEGMWQRISGHYLAFHNRLRVPDYELIFRNCGFDILSCVSNVDERALTLFRDGFRVSSKLAGYSAEDLCRRDILLCAQPAT